MKKIFQCIIFVLLTLLFEEAEAGVRAGTARISLTPPLEMKFALGGYGARMSRPAEGVHDHIWAKAIVFEDEKKKFALVTMDILALPPNVKPLVIQRLNGLFTQENVLFLPSHTHSSLDMMALNDKNSLNIPQLGIFQPELLEFLVPRLARVIEEAGSELHPVVVGTGRMNVEDMNRNRRNDPAVDRDLTVTRVDRADGSPMAVLVNWTAHPTIMDEEDMWVSAGWPGYLQRELETLIDGCPMAMYYNGAQGDQSVLRPEGASHYEQAEQYGRAMAVRAVRVYHSIQTEKAPVFTFAYSRFALPKPVSHKAFKDTGGDEYAIDDPVMQIILTRLCPSYTETVALRLGGLLIAGVPGELACGLGIEVKKKLSLAGVPYPVIGGLANEWISYILAREQYQKGGYEASVSFFGPSLGDSVVNGMTETALTLKKK